MDLPASLHFRLLRIAAQVIRDALSDSGTIRLRSSQASRLRSSQAEVPPPVGAEMELMQPAGAFVSLHDKSTHRLRGCIGSFDTTRPMVQSVMATARAVLDDPRFVNFPVTLVELPELEIEISVLSPLKPAADALAFDLLNDGIYLSISGRSGCFLPQVARETGWDREQLLGRLCSEKLGLPAVAWKSPGAKLQIFEVVIVGPRAFSEIFSENEMTR